jgi:histidinol-phosphate aminotransferase
MHFSRRSFVKAASVGGLGVLTTPLIAARGSEALRESLGESYFPLGPTTAFASEERARARLLAPTAIRLDSNENPNGPGKTALDAIRAQFGETPRYPDVPASDLQQAIAANLKVSPENVLVGCGSGEILRLGSYAFTSPERALVTAAPSFEDPVRHSEFRGAQIRAIPVDGELKLDIGRMLDATSGAGMVFFCNPNNPTATVHGASVVRDFITQVNRRAPECVVMVDEAYHEYVDDPAYATMIPESLENPRVVVVRTFSKVYGMAGLRVGYVIGRPETLRQMQRHKLPNAINVLAASAAIASMPDQAHLEREKQLNRAARDYTRKAFESMGFKSGASNTNFIMVPIGRDSRGFKDACAKHGVLVGRAFPPLTTHLRVSIGTMDEMKKAVEVFRQVFSGAAN